MKGVLAGLLIAWLPPPQAKVLANKRTALRRTFTGMQEACGRAGLGRGPLVDRVGMTKIDCMGSLLDIQYYCKDVAKTRDFIRGLVLADGTVVCESAQTVYLRFGCKAGGDPLCRKTDRSCRRLGSVFAHDLDLMHASLVPPLPSTSSSKLNCFFTSKIDENILKIDPILNFPSEK